MYLVIADAKYSSPYQLLWGWASGRRGYRDMRKYLIEKVGAGAYLYQEDKFVLRVLLYNQSNYPKGALRVMRVTEAEIDLIAEWKSKVSSHVPIFRTRARISEPKESTPPLVEPFPEPSLVSKPSLGLDEAKMRRSESPGPVGIPSEGEPGSQAQAGGGPDQTAYRKAMPRIYKMLIQYDNPSKEDFNEVARSLGVDPEWVEEYHFRATIDPGIWAWLREIGIADGKIPAWVTRVPLAARVKRAP